MMRNKKKIKYDNGKITKIKWNICYDGGWGLGYNSFIIYNNKNHKHKWSVGFEDDPGDDNNGFPPRESFDDRGVNFDYSAYGFELDKREKSKSGMTILYSDNLEKIIEFPFYYGLYRNKN